MSVSGGYYCGWREGGVIRRKPANREEILRKMREIYGEAEEFLRELDEGKLKFIPLYDCWVEKV